VTDALHPLVVIGAGPCGLAVGAAARQRGMAAVLVDQDPLCASLQSYPPYMTFQRPIRLRRKAMALA